MPLPQCPGHTGIKGSLGKQTRILSFGVKILSIIQASFVFVRYQTKKSCLWSPPFFSINMTHFDLCGLKSDKEYWGTHLVNYFFCHCLLFFAQYFRTRRIGFCFHFLYITFSFFLKPTLRLGFSECKCITLN